MSTLSVEYKNITGLTTDQEGYIQYALRNHSMGTQALSDLVALDEESIVHPSQYKMIEQCLAMNKVAMRHISMIVLSSDDTDQSQTTSVGGAWCMTEIELRCILECVYEQLSLVCKKNIPSFDAINLVKEEISFNPNDIIVIDPGNGASAGFDYQLDFLL